jgi:DNA-binding protein HU-beta
MDNMNVNKKELARRLAMHAGFSDVDANAVIGFVVDEIKAAVESGEQVSLAGFGVFEARRRAPRMGRNPKNGDAKKIPARTMPVFRPGKTFREAVTAAAEERNTP